MSYILDALRKADAQRASDPARGIHAQAATVTVVPEAPANRRRSLVWGVLALLLAIAVAWFRFGAKPVAAPPVTATPAPAPAVVRVEPARVAPPVPANEVLPPAPEPLAPVVTKAPPPVPAAAPAPAPAPVVAVPAPAAPAASAAGDRVYSLAELPPDVLQALPKFSVSGGVYSTNVAQRMLVVNGEVFNEGSEIAAGVVLEQIRPRVAVLKFRGLRISQPY